MLATKRRKSSSFVPARRPSKRNSSTLSLKAEVISSVKISGKDSTTKVTSSNRADDVVSQQIKELVDDLIEQSDYAEYKTQAKRIKKQADLKEHLQIIKRIESAITQGVCEIGTFEFFNFFDPFVSGTITECKADIRVVFCNEQVIEKSVYKGPIKCSSKLERMGIVSYMDLDEKLKTSQEAFLVVSVDATGSADLRRAARKSIANDATLQLSYYGVRKIMSRRDDEHMLTTVHCNSSVPMLSSSRANQCDLHGMNRFGWQQDLSLLRKAATIGQGLIKSGPVAQLNFELSDQHCDQNWDVIKTNLNRRFAVRRPTKSSVRFVVSNGFHPENSENCDPMNGSSVQSPEVVVHSLPLHCPFLLKNFDTNDQLMNHLNSSFKGLQFAMKSDSEIVISLAASQHQLATSVTSLPPVVPKIVKPLEVVPKIRMPCPETTEIVAKEFATKKFYRIPNATEWVEEKCIRGIKELVDSTPEEQQFMIMFNEFSFKNPYMVSKAQKEELLISFVNAHCDDIIQKKLEMHACLCFSTLAARGIISPPVANSLYSKVMTASLEAL